jgi:hypothetical protein
LVCQPQAGLAAQLAMEKYDSFNKDYVSAFVMSDPCIVAQVAKARAELGPEHPQGSSSKS